MVFIVWGCKKLSDNVYKIWKYVFTERINNAIGLL